MPVTSPLEASETFFDVVRGLGSGLCDTFDAWLNQPSGPSDLGEATAAVWEVMAHLQAVLPDVRDASPDQLYRFLVGDSDSPGPGQATLPQFSTMVSTKLAALGVIPTPLIVEVAKALRNTLKFLGPNVDPETWIRWVTGVHDKADALTSADGLAKALSDGTIIHGPFVPDGSHSIPDNFPTPDAAKEEALKKVTPPGWYGPLANVIARIPDGTPVSDRFVGQSAHKFLQAAYVADFQNHFVIVDGRAHVYTTDSTTFQVSAMMDSVPKLQKLKAANPEYAEKLEAFYLAMRAGGKNPVRPDIADLEDAAQGIDPNQDWGWFEIKPARSLRRAYTELYVYYLGMWNRSPAVMAHQPEWTGKPGTWLAPLAGLLVDITPMRVIGSFTMGPGAIGYITVPIKGGEEVKVTVAVLAGLATLFANKLAKSLNDWHGENGALNPVIALVGAVLLCILLLLLIDAAAVALAWTAAAAALAAVIAAILPPIQQLPVVV